MITTLAVSGYRSLRDVVLPLAPLTVVTGANGTGKSSLYRALRLLADCGTGDVIGSLAREGGLQSVLWAGPETLAGARREGVVQGTMRKERISLRLGCATDDFGYLIDLGLPVPSSSLFDRDPEIKREVVWSGAVMRPATALVQRTRRLARCREESGWVELTDALPSFRSMLTEFSDHERWPELAAVRSQLRSWRFYDGFRCDSEAPARLPQVGTRSPVLAGDGANLAATVQTTIESGHTDFAETIAEALDGSRPEVVSRDGVFELVLHQPGMLRPLRASELSDGTLRFILWAAALTSVHRPSLMVLNEPESSIHPSLLPALAELMTRVARHTQLIVVSHAGELVDHLGAKPFDGEIDGSAVRFELAKDLGETRVEGMGMLTTPSWEWGKR
ncbi:AAA family ATPase [Calidifontibacter sp. DB0510]|uniref:AAA family ATPase n=1 Tax=Metallococcus carri TaxID=1656884 RepID=A0A967E8Z0_9MICO|nr:AAA family ATPase [Metallococcus carri]NHN54319.1 AAA family ATPase [Metallococcus carri]NOP36841.1 AAA family ATPase [Calidifontibacter sp. DB2511S]